MLPSPSLSQVTPRDARSGGHFALAAALASVGSVLAAWFASRDPWSPIAIGLWLFALALLIGAGIWHDRPSLDRLRTTLSTLRRRELQREIAVVFAVTTVAFMLRAYDLQNLPPAMHGDEGEMGVLALQALESPEPPALFGTSWLDHPSFFYYLQAAALTVFGKNVVGLRMLSAIFGALCIPLVYAIGRVGWGQLAGFTAAWLMAVAHLHIHYSRLALNNIESVWAMCLMMLLLAVAYERHAPLPEGKLDHASAPAWRESITLYVSIGLVIGLSQYLYHGSRLLPPTGALLLGFLWRSRRASVQQLAIVVVAAFIAFAPLGWHYVDQPHTFFDRMRGVSIFIDQNVKHVLGPQARLPDDALQLLGGQLQRNLSFFVDRRDATFFYDAEVARFDSFDILTKVMFWLGLGLALWRVRRYHEFAVVAWFILGLLFGGVITIDAPNGPRLLMIIPVVYLMAGVSVTRAWQYLSTLRGAHRLATPALVTLCAAVLALNLRTYLVDYAQNALGLMPIAVAREMIADSPSRYRTYLMGAPTMFAEHGVLRFVAGKARARNLDHPDDVELPFGAGLLVIALPHRIEDLKQIETLWPGGNETRHTDLQGRLLYVAYRITPRGPGQ